MRSSRLTAWPPSRVDWAVISASALVVFVGLATAGRPPAVDLPQHALTLRRLLEGDNALFEVRWSAPYVGFFVLAVPLAELLDPVRAVWITSALAIGLLPIAGAALAASLGRTPLLGSFAMLGAFTSITAWGFAPFTLGAVLATFAVASAIHYAEVPSLPRGALLALLLASSYSVHLSAVVVALPIATVVLVSRVDVVRPARLWPVLAGTAWAVALGSHWLAAIDPPGAYFDADGPTAHERLEDLVDTAAAFGRPDALARPWIALALVATATLAIGAVVGARTARPGPSDRIGLRRRAGTVLIASLPILAFVGYLDGSLSRFGTFHLYPRYLVLTALFLPAAVGGVASVIRLTSAVGVAAAIWLGFAARAEVVAYARQTRCVGQLSRNVRPGEALKAVRAGSAPLGYTLPVSVHVAAEATALHGGLQDKEFADKDMSAVAYRPGIGRSVMTWERERDELLEYTAWFILHPRAQDLGSAYVFGEPVRVLRCGDYALAIDDRIAPGSRQPFLRLPHRLPPSPSTSRSGR